MKTQLARNLGLVGIINAAVGEKVAALHTLDYLRERATRGSRAAFDAVLAKVPDVDPPD